MYPFHIVQGSGVTETACTKIYIQNSESDVANYIASKQKCMQKWELILSLNLEKYRFCSHSRQHKGQNFSKISLTGSAGDQKIGVHIVI